MMLRYFFAAAFVTMVHGYNPEDFIHSLGASRLGFWGRTDACPEGSYAYAFEIKVEPQQGPIDDDTSVNHIRLHCGTPEGVETGTVSSMTMNRGSWSGIHKCAPGSFLKGYQLKSEADSNTCTDKTAANALRMWCTESDRVLEGHGTKWGYWLERADCKGNKVICGLMTRVQEEQGKLHDDTALNDVRFLCCDPPHN